MYRILIDKRHAVNEYYQIHIAFKVGVLLSDAMVFGVYICWYNFTQDTKNFTSYFLLINNTLDLVSLIAMAAICESANIKVSCKAVSYTHLDVYKRQVTKLSC